MQRPKTPAFFIDLSNKRGAGATVAAKATALAAFSLQGQPRTLCYHIITTQNLYNDTA